MTISEISKKDYIVFAVFACIWVFLGWVSYLLALGGFFYSWIFSGFFILLAAVAVFKIISRKLSIKISIELLIISLSVLAFVAILSFFVTPTIFSGRDQGALSEAAIRLSQNHQLEFSTPASQEFFKIYGPGKALNFPGFYYNSQGLLITSFPIAYIAWLGVFYSIFGLAGLIIANSVLLFLFLISFYLGARIFLRIKPAIILLAVTATAFPFFWFFKFTLSENMAIALFWTSILWILLFLKEQKAFYYFSFLISAGLLVFTRIEGIFLLISGALTMYFFTQKNSFWKEKKKTILIYPAISLIILLLMNFTKDIYFYKEIAKAVLHFGNNGSENISFWPSFLSKSAAEFQIFNLYGLIGFVLLGIISIIFFFKKKEWGKLAIFFVILPTFIYLANPWISSDHPWMLRRFLFSIFPALIFYSILFLDYWLNEKKLGYRKFAVYLAIVSIFVSNLYMFFVYFPFSENKNLLGETKNISQNFGNNDLVLVDRLASGDSWSMITGPMNFLYNKDAVYFFNPEDYKKIDKGRFTKIYLITLEENASFWIDSIGKENLIGVKDYSIQNESLIANNNSTLPAKSKQTVSGKIFEIRNAR